MYCSPIAGGLLCAGITIPVRQPRSETARVIILDSKQNPQSSRRNSLPGGQIIRLCLLSFVESFRLKLSRCCFNTRSSRSHGLNPLRWRLPLALRPEVSNALLSVRAGAPVTRYCLRLATRAGRPEEATPSIQRRATQALHSHGLPPPASSARRDPVGFKRLSHFEGRSFW